jgi:hypothetical protein
VNQEGEARKREDGSKNRRRMGWRRKNTKRKKRRKVKVKAGEDGRGKR